MPLGAHLAELRRRLLLAVLGVLIGAVVGWFLYTPVFKALQEPLLTAAARDGTIININFTGMTSAFDVRLKVSAFIGLIVTSPWWLYQVWAFVTPGLKKTERRYALGFVFTAVPMFLIGAGLGWLLLPRAVLVLTEFVPHGATNLTDAQMYLSFVMRLMLAFGIAFVLPVLMVVLNMASVVRARTWAKGWRWAIVIAFTFAAVMTPTPDAWTMVLVALPICLLYVIALGLCILHDRRYDRRQESLIAAALG
ncbi:sec-independent protein translocase protein TatC [Rarobacter faecitabidus]|uniref:Sec-independent protein translocase protein TatC n=2 Tax=Rarobacter faecitabidus TaxID=13243 RepID=A0A542ZVL2_RARFA|nr:twin-arginine translocase subunit TatC [Rarobacter faecitabidus]TQL64397.1 sec-independent protein translocase protein TatC [Rarobacter faecitabidus]